MESTAERFGASVASAAPVTGRGWGDRRAPDISTHTRAKTTESLASDLVPLFEYLEPNFSGRDPEPDIEEGVGWCGMCDERLAHVVMWSCGAPP
jgi:hypothetical protein